MLSYCSNCGLVFDTSPMANMLRVTFEDCKTICPHCKSTADVLDGTFNFDANGVITLLSGTPFTHSIILAIKQLAEKAKSEGYTGEQFIKEATLISPDIGSNLSKFIPKNFSDLVNFFVLIIALLTYLSVNNNKHQNTSTHIQNISVEKSKTPVQKTVISTKNNKLTPHKNKWWKK